MSIFLSQNWVADAVALAWAPRALISPAMVSVASYLVAIGLTVLLRRRKQKSRASTTALF
jgi:nitrate reductase gamma subunit